MTAWAWQPRAPRFRPTQDNVLCVFDHHRDARTEKRLGLLVLPSSTRPADHEPCLATVVAAGPGAYDEAIRHDEGVRNRRGMRTYETPKASRKYVPMDPGIRPGARVLISMAIAGDVLMLDGVEHRVVRAEQVLGVVEEE